MYVENELVEIVTTDDREFEEIVEEYKEEILMQEEVPEPPLTKSRTSAYLEWFGNEVNMTANLTWS